MLQRNDGRNSGRCEFWGPQPARERELPRRGTVDLLEDNSESTVRQGGRGKGLFQKVERVGGPCHRVLPEEGRSQPSEWDLLGYKQK